MLLSSHHLTWQAFSLLISQLFLSWAALNTHTWTTITPLPAKLHNVNFPGAPLHASAGRTQLMRSDETQWSLASSPSHSYSLLIKPYARYPMNAPMRIKHHAINCVLSPEKAPPTEVLPCWPTPPLNKKLCGLMFIMIPETINTAEAKMSGSEPEGSFLRGIIKSHSLDEWWIHRSKSPQNGYYKKTLWFYSCIAPANISWGSG